MDKRRNKKPDDAEKKSIEAARKAIHEAYWKDWSNLPSVWVARDKDGELWLYNNKPVKTDFAGIFHNGAFGDGMPIDNRIYPEITYDNSPVKIKLLFIDA